MSNPPKCPECGRVMLQGNVLNGEKERPVRHWDCPVVIIADSDIDEMVGMA